MSLPDLFIQAAHNPILGLTCLLVLAVVLVNGWTNASNAIVTVAPTGALSFRWVVALAMACNLLGVLVTTVVNATVAGTVHSIADFGPDRAAALSALCVALCTIALWAILAWRFGVPTSESHALVAGLTGTALALPGGLDNIRVGVWGRVLLGLVLSVALGWWMGGLCRRLLEYPHPSPPPCRRGQLARAGAMAFLHGAQDGQKFLGVFLLSAALAQGGGAGQTFPVPSWLILLRATVMTLGTAMGGWWIIETAGQDMVILAPREGLAADLGGGLCLLLCTLVGPLVSITHAKIVAILGAGSADGGTVNHRAAARIALTWLFTFPGYGLLGLLLVSLFRSSLSCGILMPGMIFRHSTQEVPTMCPYDIVIFDLDGTLLNALQDLADSTNYTLVLQGTPARTLEEVRRFVGNGVGRLIYRAVPKGTPEEVEARVPADFRTHYILNMEHKTTPYPGVLPLLDRLGRAGTRTAVMSNKFDNAVKGLCHAYFGVRISAAIGESQGVARKLAPDMVFYALEELGTEAGRAVYVGGSDVDIQTAANARLPCLLVSWGSRDAEFLTAHGAQRTVDTPQALEALLLGA